MLTFTVENTFHSSKDCPLYNGFSFIQRLSTVLWFSFTQNHVYPHFPLSSSVIPRLFTLRPTSSVFLCVFPSFVIPLLIILWFSASNLFPVILIMCPNRRNSFSSVTSYIVGLMMSFRLSLPFISLLIFYSTPFPLPLLYFLLRTLKTRQTLRTAHWALDIQTNYKKDIASANTDWAILWFPLFLKSTSA